MSETRLNYSEDEKDEVNTKKSTKWAVKTLHLVTLATYQQRETLNSPSASSCEKNMIKMVRNTTNLLITDLICFFCSGPWYKRDNAL